MVLSLSMLAGIFEPVQNVTIWVHKIRIKNNICAEGSLEKITLGSGE